jgi:hypothetical protein
MTEVDWSKAPEWANVRLVHVSSGGIACWASAYKEGATASWGDRKSLKFKLIAKHWVVLDTRPTTQPAAWNGRGLPPVGTVCEVMVGGLPSVAQDWEECTVLVVNDGIGGKMQVCTRDFRGDLAIYHPEHDAVYFRPIQTTEQIAADDREAAVDKLTALLDSDRDRAMRLIAEAIYDSGYRKQEQAQ